MNCLAKSIGGGGWGVSVDEQKSAGNTSNSIKHPRNLIREIRTSMGQLHAAVVLPEQEVRRVFKGIMVLVSHRLSSQERSLDKL